VLIPLLAVLMLVVAASPATSASRTTIRLKDNVFSPKSKTISKGTKVTFRWAGKNPHNVTVSRGPKFKASPTKKKGTFRHTFSRTGRYTIICTIHEGMRLKLRVK